MKHDTFSDFLSETKRLLSHYAGTRIRLYSLRIAKTVSLLIADLIWAMVSLFLFFLLLIFAGLTTGFWLTSLTGSYTAGFGFTTLGIVLLVWLVYVFRQQLFVNPIIKATIRRMAEHKSENSNTSSPD